MTTEYEYLNDRTALAHGDCLDIMRGLPDGYVDAIVTDPPYGLGFMGKAWDDLPPGEPWARECLRVLKPGGHLLAFGGTRTFHRLAVAVEDAGFEIRDSIAWLYGSGFPKALDVGKAIDKAAGVEREVLDTLSKGRGSLGNRSRVAQGYRPTELNPEGTVYVTAPATDAARQWQGWGTALKPAFEPIIVARKPLDGTVAANVIAYGTGALNIDATRIEASGRPLIISKNEGSTGIFGDGLNGSSHGGVTNEGRWPANVILDDAAAGELDRQTGGASRFFYVAKAPAKERPKVDGVAHPTVKPLSLMRWLVRLVTPPDGILLDPFAGSGTTLQAAQLEGFRSLGIEREQTYLPLIRARFVA
jgi:site-specific DNA-methyltransferase (adenine-specific)